LLTNQAHLDLMRGLEAYDAWAQVMAVFVPDTVRGDAAWEHVCRVLDFAEKEERRHPDCLKLVYTAADMERALANRRCAVILAVEGGAALGGDVRRLKLLADRGVAALNITWNGSNELANGCLSPDTSGLTSLGREAVREMYAVGILPDVSHLNKSGFWEVAAIADGRPFLAGHSVSAAVCKHPRNLTDEQFRAVRDSGGLVGITLCADQLGGQSFEQLERHLTHFLSLGGENTVAVGFDLDGTELPPEWGGIVFAASFYRYLLQKGYDPLLLSAIFFENAHAFFVKALTSKEECIKIGT
ncbi:MAG: dipeptidase, partial [Acutalibacteraceae bacterium]